MDPTTNLPKPETKKPWESKTLIIGAVTALVPFIPAVGPLASGWIAANPELFASLIGGLFTALRLTTKDKVSIK